MRLSCPTTNEEAHRGLCLALPTSQAFALFIAPNFPMARNCWILHRPGVADKDAHHLHYCSDISTCDKMLQSLGINVDE